MKRYDIEKNGDGEITGMAWHPAGDYVLHADHAAALAEKEATIAAQRALIERAQSDLAEAIGTSGERHEGCGCPDRWRATLAAIREHLAGGRGA